MCKLRQGSNCEGFLNRGAKVGQTTCQAKGCSEIDVATNYIMEKGILLVGVEAMHMAYYNYFTLLYFLVELFCV